MNDDQLFRAILIVGFIIFIPIGLYHRIKSQATGEKLDRLQEGLFILISLRLAGALAWGGLLAYMIDPDWMAWASVPLPAWVRWLGVGLGIIAGVLGTWTFRNLGKNITDTVVTRANHSLVTTGPYRWVRHPFYLTAAIGGPAACLVTGNWYVAVTGGFVFVLLVIRTRKEEEKLIERFGDEYRRYMERTGRFLPRFR